MHSGKLDSAKVYFDAIMIIDLKYKVEMYMQILILSILNWYY